MFIDLHRHIEGSISPFVAAKIGEPLSCRWTSGGDFFSIWGPVIAYMRSPNRYGEVALCVLEELATKGTRYVEFQFSPAETHVDPFETAKAIADAFDRANRAWGIGGGLIYNITRHLTDTIEQDCESALELFEKGLICGVGLAGDEINFPIRSIAGKIRPVVESSVPKAFHAGEFGGPSEVENAIALGATRIGHGNHLIEDRQLLDLVQSRRIGVEVCITSELMLNNVTSWEVHPLRTFLELGVLLNLNTDDPAVFGTEIDAEYKKAEALVSADLLNQNAIEMAFAPAELKRQLVEMAIAAGRDRSRRE